MKKSILLVVLMCVFVACFSVFMVSCGKKGETKTKGEVIFRVVDSSVEWKYDYEGDDKWREVPVKPEEIKQENEAYLLFKEAHPEYTGDEKQWLDDLVNDRLIYYTKFTVSFDTSGGSEIEEQKVKLGETATEPQTIPQKAGYDFVCWQNGDKDYDFSTVIVNNIKLTAKWSLVTYNVSYDLTGCGVNSEENPENYTIESEIPLKEPTANDGFKFLRWERVITLEDGTQTSETITKISNGIYGDLTLRAVWEESIFKFELKDDDTYKLVKYYKDDMIVVIPSTYEGKAVTEIGESAFQSKRILSVTLPETLTTIGDLAFYHSRVAEIINLSKINFTGASFYEYGWITAAPKLVIKTSGTSDIYNVGEFYFLSFDGSEYLIYYAGTDKKVKIPSLGNDKKIIINNFAFEKYVDDYSKTNELEEVDMSANVCEVKSMAFLGCTALKKVIVGTSLAKLDNESFMVSGISTIDVYYLGTEEDWNKITIDQDPEDKPMYYDMVVYYYSETKPAGDGKYWHYDANGDAVSW